MSMDVLDLAVLTSISAFFGVLAVVVWRAGKVPYDPEGRTAFMREQREAALEASAIFRATASLSQAIAVQVPRLGVGGHLAWLKKNIAYAGYPKGATPEAFVAESLLWTAIGVTGAVLLSFVAPVPLVGLLLGLSLLTHALRCRALTKSAQDRRRLMAVGLPYFMDLVSLSMDSGATFPHACRSIVDGPVKGPVEECVGAMLMELRAGAPRSEAIGNMLQRSDAEELETMVGAVKQGEKLGSRLVDTFRRQAELSRFRRLQRGQQLAAKLPTRLSVPTVLMMLACLVLLIGPVLIKAFSAGFGGLEL